MIPCDCEQVTLSRRCRGRYPSMKRSDCTRPTLNERNTNRWLLYTGSSSRLITLNELMCGIRSAPRSEYSSPLFPSVSPLCFYSGYVDRAYARFLWLHRYSPACTRLLSQYKTMLKLVADDVSTIDEFLKKYKVRALALVRRIRFSRME